MSLQIRSLPVDFSGSDPPDVRKVELDLIRIQAVLGHPFLGDLNDLVGQILLGCSLDVHVTADVIVGVVARDGLAEAWKMRD